MPKSLWGSLKDDLIAQTEALTVGDVEDLSNFTSAVIDAKSHLRLKNAIDRAHATAGIDVIAGGTYDDSTGYFVRPTLLLGGDPSAAPEETYATWSKALALPGVRGLVAGRALLFPPDGDVEHAVDSAVSLVGAA